jgi:Flp pilus assembly protein TadD
MKWMGLALIMFLAGCTRVTTSSSARLPMPVREVKNATRLGDGDLELAKLRQAVIDYPNDNEARLKLAAHYEALGMDELALEHYRLAGERRPGDELAAYRYAMAVRKTDPAAARLELRRFVSHHPVRSAATYSLLGILDDQAGDWVIGEVMHREALKLEPKSDGLRNNLGFNLMSQGKLQPAVAEFRQALRLRPGSAVARNNMANAIAAMVENEQDQSESAVRIAFGQWKKAGGDAGAHNNLAAVYMRQGRYKEARKELEAAVRKQPDLAAAWRNLQQLSALDGGRPEVAVPGLARGSSAWRAAMTPGSKVPQPKANEIRTEGEGPTKSLRETIGTGEDAADAKEQ